MADERIIGATNQSAPQQQRTLAELYAGHIGYIVDLAMCEPGLTPEDAQAILDGIGSHLARYDRELTDDAFEKWATGIILPLRRFYAIKRECEPFVRSAIWRGLGHSSEPSKYDDYPETVREIEQELWTWVYLNLDTKLAKVGTAKMSTRLYSKAATITRGWMSKQQDRRAAVIRHVYRLPKPSKAPKAAAQLAAVWDREAREQAAEQVVREEIRDQMQESGIAA